MAWRNPDRVIHHPAFTLRYAPTTKATDLRIVVGTKLSKKATVRNQLKRRVREIWRRLAIPPNIRVTLYAKQPALLMKFTELTSALTRLTVPLKRD